MAKVKKTPDDSKPKRKIKPAMTPEGRENQLISLAYDLVQERLLDGTASSQETTHFLKLGCEKARLEKEKLIEENKLLRAKTEQIQASQETERLYAEAIKAMQRYSGNGGYDDEDDEDDEEY